jgi:hypothetical protein
MTQLGLTTNGFTAINQRMENMEQKMEVYNINQNDD